MLYGCLYIYTAHTTCILDVFDSTNTYIYFLMINVFIVWSFRVILRKKWYNYIKYSKNKKSKIITFQIIIWILLTAKCRVIFSAFKVQPNIILQWLLGTCQLIWYSIKKRTIFKNVCIFLVLCMYFGSIGYNV